MNKTNNAGVVPLKGRPRFSELRYGQGSMYTFYMEHPSFLVLRRPNDVIRVTVEAKERPGLLVTFTLDSDAARKMAQQLEALANGEVRTLG